MPSIASARSIVARSTCFLNACVLGLGLGLGLGLAAPGHAAESPGVAADSSGPARAAEGPEKIVVTASPLARTSNELAIPVVVRSREALLDEAGATLGESLRRAPGITTSSYAAGASRPVIRGQDQLRVRVLENGIGTGDVSGLSPDHGVTINPLTVRRLEVVRGPATLRYGGGAIAGVVNAITGRVPELRTGRALSSEIYSAYGTGARERNLAGLFEGDSGPITWHLDGVSVDSRDFDIPGSPGQQLNSATDRYAFAGGASWFSESLRVGASVSRERSDYGLPGVEDPDDTPSISLEQDHYALELDAFPGGDWIDAIRLRGARTEYLHAEVGEGEGPPAIFDNEEIELRTELAHVPLGPLEGVLGFQYQNTRFKAGGEAGELLPASKTDLYGLYLFERLQPTPQLDVELAGRIESVRIDGVDLAGEDRSRSFSPLSASASLLYQLSPDWAVGLALTAAQRAPAASELFSQGPHDATATFELGDPDADEERSLTADLSLRGGRGPLSGQLNVFYTDYDNFTFGRLTGTSRDEDGTVFADLDSGELRDLVFSQDDARFVGAELEVEWELMALGDGDVSLELQSDVLRARLGSGDVPRIPPLRWGLAVAYHSPRFSGRLGFLRAEAQDDLADFEERTSGYTSVDGSIRLRIAGSRERPIDLTLSVRNLLDARARNHVSFKKEDVLLPGRDVRLGIQIRF